MRYLIEYFNDYIIISKINTQGKNLKSFEYIKDLENSYSYIYKSSNKPRRLQFFDGTYSKYIFSNIEIDHLFYLYNIKCFRFIKNVYKEQTLYNIKEKIEIL